MLYVIREMVKKSQLFETMRGWYFDPFHGGCHRFFDKEGTLVGLYGTDEKNSGTLYTNKAFLCNTPKKQHLFQKRLERAKPEFQKKYNSFLESKIEHTKLVVDFKNKEFVDHDRYYIAIFEKKTKLIHWEDNNIWYPGIHRTKSVFDFF